MPLPTSNIKWPPAPFDTVSAKYKELAAWYSGDPQALMSYYGSHVTSHSGERASQFYGGLVGAVSRIFWGTPKSRGTSYRNKLHIPLAEEIAAESSHQLFRRPPKIEVSTPEHQARIEKYIDNGLFVKLLEAAEISSALGDIYLRVGYDSKLSDMPLLSIVYPDLAIPTFSYDILTSVMFWRIIESETGRIYRHLELHERGSIQHGLYAGTATTIGSRVPLATVDETSRLKDEVDTKLLDLDCVFVPNLKTRTWHDLGQASNLGRSDYHSAIGTMDALDETWTSWMRDIHLGKARLIVPQGYLSTKGRGQESTFDLDQSVFVEMNALGGGGDKMEIHPNQFAIRYEAHSSTASALMERIVSGSGYSAQTFGLTPSVAMTATESDSRDSKTRNTRGAKIEVWKRAIAKLLSLMLQIDSQWGKVAPPTAATKITIEFPPATEVPLSERAQTAKTMKEADAASRLILVRLLHPDWPGERVEEEVAMIQQEGAQSREGHPDDPSRTYSR